MITIVNDNGRPFEQIDLLRLGAPCTGSFTVTTMAGDPIFGRHVSGSAQSLWMVDGWYACCELDRQGEKQ